MNSTKIDNEEKGRARKGIVEEGAKKRGRASPLAAKVLPMLYIVLFGIYLIVPRTFLVSVVYLIIVIGMTGYFWWLYKKHYFFPF